ncbi:carbohydrate esterase family 5 protein [Xylariomycetidae sp. FL2044]|nr:carbohydrate esterase family 5 protein [Xylariomycetidae sp. FL2044]
MRASFTLTTAVLATLASATPLTFDLSEAQINKLKAGQTNGISARQDDSTTANEFLEGGCRDLIFIYARGSTQDGNIGQSPGPQTIEALKSALGDDYVAAQGVEYPASLLDNLLSGGCDPEDAENMLALITQAATECPDSAIAVSGYSQGAALVHRSVEAASAAVMGQIVAAVTFGDTQKQQDGDQIPNFDTAKTLILCHDGDLVCEGTLTITDNHYDYEDLSPEAADFIISKL